MISLASATWKLGIRLTLRKLAAFDEISSAIASEKAVSDYEVMYLTPKKRVDEFWERCRLTHVAAETSGLRMLQRRFAANTNDPEWINKAGVLIGSCYRKEVDSCFNPQKTANWDQVKNQRSGSCPSHVFKGKNWNELLAVPYWDLPGRVCGFLFIGREADITNDFVYKGMLYGSFDAGIAMLPTLLQGAHNRFGHTKFIFTDVDIAIRFHVRHSRDHDRMLPLGATWDRGNYATNKVWEWCHSDQLVFWGSDRLKTIAQAKKARGKVSMLQVTPTELETNMRNYSPAEWLERIRLQTMHWAPALQDYLSQVGELEAEEAFLYLDMHGKELEKFIEGCPHKLKNRLSYISAHRTFSTKVKFEGQWVFEKSDGWYLEKGGERISDAIVRVEELLTTLNNRSYYRGVVRFKDQTYPFTEKAKVLDRGMLEWAHTFLRDKMRVGVCQFYPSWNKKSINLAFLFSPPRLAQGVEMIGWDTVNRQFNFPKFSIKSQGAVTTEFSCLFDNDRVPARDLPAPGVMPRKHIETLSEQNDETRIFWAMAACVAANIIAPAVNRNQLPILLDGHGAQGVGSSAAVRLGCTELNTGMKKGRNDPCTVIGGYNTPHSWPTVVSPEIIRIGSWIDKKAAQNCIFSVPWILARVLALRGRVNIISQRRKLGSMQLAHHAAPYVLPNYIQDLYRRNILIPDERPDLVIDVLADLATWFGRIGGDRKAIEAASQIVYAPNSRPAADYFCELVFRLHSTGSLKFSHAAIDKTRSAILMVDKGENLIWISQDQFSDAVKRAGALAPDLLLVTKSLADSGVLLAEPECRQEQGWLIRGDWWNSKLEKWRADEHDDA